MTRSVICISHEAGAGGRELATAVAQQLEYRLVDEEIVAHAAARENVTVEELADVERRKSFLARMMLDFGRSGAAFAGPATGGVPVEVLNLPTPGQLRGAITTAIEEIAASGRVVIVSHAASHALRGDDVLRVLVVAPDVIRLARLTERGTGDTSPEKALADSDAGRRSYLKSFYGIDRESPHQYDLVVNTGAIEPEAFVPTVLAAADA